MKILEMIWKNYIQSEEYMASPDRVRGIPEIAEGQLKASIGTDEFPRAEDVVMSVASEAEEKGFVQGFKMAMAIRNECMG